MAPPENLTDPAAVDAEIDAFIKQRAAEEGWGSGSDTEGSVFAGNPDPFGTLAAAPRARKNASSDPLRVRRQFGKSYPGWAARARAIALVPAPPPRPATPPPPEPTADACSKCAARESRRRQRAAPASPAALWDEKYLIAALASAILDGATPKQLPTTAKGVDPDLAARGAALAAWWREKFPAPTTEA